MTSSLSNLVDNLAGEIHEIKCKYGHDNKKCERVELKTKIVSAVLSTQMLNII